MGQIEIRQAGAGTPAATGDFFICDMPWASPKDDMASMEHPLVHAGDPAGSADPAL